MAKQAVGASHKITAVKVRWKTGPRSPTILCYLLDDCTGVAAENMREVGVGTLAGGNW